MESVRSSAASHGAEKAPEMRKMIERVGVDAAGERFAPLFVRYLHVADRPFEYRA